MLRSCFYVRFVTLFSDSQSESAQGLIWLLSFVCVSADVSSRPRITFSAFQATEELQLESDRRFRLEEALRCARICVRCGHPRVFITGNLYGFNFWHNQMSNCFFTSDNLSAGSPTHHPRELSRESSRTR